MSKNINNLIKKELPYLIEEIAEEVYQNSKIDVFERRDVEHIVTYMRAETEIILTRAMISLVDIVYKENED